MKKFTTLLTMAFIALMSISFTSCDDDSDIAYTLDGTWNGNMSVEYGNYDAVYSVIHFDQTDGIYSGTGYWIDYYQGDYWHGNNYIANRIRWTVRNKSIYIDFLDENSNGAIISDYALSDRKFSGYVEVPGNGTVLISSFIAILTTITGAIMTGATIGTTMTVGATASSIRAWRTPRLFLAELRIL